MKEGKDLIHSLGLNSVVASFGRRRTVAMLTVIVALFAVIGPTYVSANDGNDLSSAEKTLLKSGEPLTVGLDAETGAVVSVELTEDTARGVGAIGATNPSR